MSIIRIGISGKANSGKDTIGKYISTLLNENTNQNTFSLSFAKPIKEIAKLLYPQINNDYLFGPSKYRDKMVPNMNFTIRDLLIDIGEHYREKDPLVWIKNFDTTIVNYINNNIIATDIRFIDEYNYLKNNNFILIRIKRNNSTIINDLTEKEQDHLLDNKFDFIIENNNDLQFLYNSVDKVIKKIIK